MSPSTRPCTQTVTRRINSQVPLDKIAFIDRLDKLLLVRPDVSLETRVQIGPGNEHKMVTLTDQEPRGFWLLFDAGDFPPRWHCGNWSEALGWTHIIADILIFIAYAAIPASLFFFIRRRPDVPLRFVFWLFISFILSCGLTHLVDAVMFYHPMYRFLGVMKVITAAVSLLTVVFLVRLLPVALALPAAIKASNTVRTQLAEKTLAESRLRSDRDFLESRTSELTVRDNRLRRAMSKAGGGAMTWDINSGQITWEIGLSEAVSGHGVSAPPIARWPDVLSPEVWDRFRAETEAANREQRRLVIELPLALQSGANIAVRIHAHRENQGGEGAAMFSGLFIVREVEERSSVV